MGWKGKRIFIGMAVLTLILIQMLGLIRGMESYRTAVTLLATLCTLSIAWFAYLEGRHLDKALNNRNRNEGSIGMIGGLGQAGRDIRESGEHYPGLLEQIPDGVMVMCDGRIVYSNSAGLRLLGTPDLQSSVNRNFLERIHPDDREEMEELFRANTDKSREVRILKRDGTSVEAEIQACRIVYRGKPAVQIILRDLTGLRRSEKDLLAAQLELQELLRHQQGITFKYQRSDSGFIHTFWDGELTYEMGLPPVQVIGKSLKELFASETVSAIEPYYAQAWDEGCVVVFETELLQTPCHITLRPIIRNGLVEEVVGYCTDILLRKQAEEELFRAKELLESFFRNTTDAIDVHDLEGYILHTNQAFEHIYGWSYEECIGKKLMAIIPSDLQDEMEAVHEAISLGGHISGYETVRLRKDGRLVDVSVTISPVWDDNGNIVAIAAISRDISERKQVESALRKSEAKYRLIAENMRDLISVLDYQGTIAYISPSCKTMLGLDPETFIGASILEWMHPEDQGHIGTFYNQTLAADPDEIIEVRFRHADGHWVMLESSSRWIPDLENGNSPNILIVARDITERKQAEEMLLKSEKLSVVGQLAAGVAHEIRNPLTSLKGFLQLLRKRSVSNDFFFEVMLSELERINTIVSEFLVLSKPQSTHFQRRNLVQIVMNVVSFLESQALMSGVQIMTDISTGPDVPVDCDENQLKQVFINFLKNAVEAMPDGGVIHVSLHQPEPGRVRIRFADEGCGIPEERIPKLGEPFYTTKEKGTGLGLMVSFRIIEDHQGTVRVSSRLGVGTTFDVDLPVLELPVPEEQMCQGG